VALGCGWREAERTIGGGGEGGAPVGCDVTVTRELQQGAEGIGGGEGGEGLERGGAHWSGFGVGEG